MLVLINLSSLLLFAVTVYPERLVVKEHSNVRIVNLDDIHQELLHANHVIVVITVIPLLAIAQLVWWLTTPEHRLQYV